MQAEVNIWSLVNSLLYNHNCVVVPNLGGFLAHQHSASIDPVSMVINPPCKTITFNAQLKLNDGLLATKVADYLKISYIDAIKIIETEVANFEHLINYNGQVAHAGLGSFTYNSEKKLVFTPEKNVNFLLHSFGLHSIRLSTIADTKTSTIISQANTITSKLTDKEETTVETAPIKQKAKQKRSRGLTFTAIGSLLILILGLNAYIFLQEGSLTPIRNKYNELNLGVTIKSWFETKTVPVEKPTAPEPIIIQEPKTNTDTVINKQLDSDSLAAIQAKEPAAINTNVKPIAAIKDEPKTEVIEAEKSAYYIIAGAFETEKWAINLVNELNKSGFAEAELIANPRTSSKDIKFFVTYKKLNDYTSSTLALNTIHKSENPDAWILLAR